MDEKKEIPIEKSMSTTLGVPEDAYECKLIKIEENTRQNKLSHKQEMGAQFTFEIIDGPYKGKIFSNFFTNKLTKRSKLSILCRAIWGGEFEPEEMAQINLMNDLQRFLLNKPLQVILLIRHSFLTDSIWYDVAFFCKSSFYDEKIAKVIIPKEKSSL